MPNVLVLAIFANFMLLLELDTKFIKFWTKSWIKQVKSLPSRCTSVLLRVFSEVLKNSARSKG